MKESNYSFLGADIIAKGAINRNNPVKAFDWDKAAAKIKELLPSYPNLTAEAGLQGDWDYTGGIIFEDGKPNSESYTYLASTWAIPTLIITADGEELIEMPCYTNKSKRFNSESKWDKASLKILGL